MSICHRVLQSAKLASTVGLQDPKNDELSSTSGLRISRMRNCRQGLPPGSPRCETVVDFLPSRSSDMGRPTHGLAGATRETRTRWVSQTHALCGWRQRVHGGFLSTIASESWPPVAAVARVAPASRDHFLREKRNSWPLAIPFYGWRRTRWRTRWRVRARSPR